MLGCVQSSLLAASPKGKVYATFDPANIASIFTLSNGNLTVTKDSSTSVGSGCAFLNVSKSSDFWAIEVSKTHTGASSTALRVFGMADNINTSGILGNYTNSEAKGAGAGGNRFKNSVTTSPASTSVFSVTTLQVYVFDCTNRLLYLPDATTPTTLTAAASALPGSGTLYFGTYMLSAASTASKSITVNTGQSAFQSGNETLVAALEASLGVTINRGLWL